MEFLFSIIASVLAVYIGSILLDGIKIRGFMHAFLVVVVIAVLNITLGSVMKVFSLGLLSAGLFKWLMDAIMIYVASMFMDRFEVKNFFWAFGLAAMISVLETVLHWFF